MQLFREACGTYSFLESEGICLPRKYEQITTPMGLQQRAIRQLICVSTQTPFGLRNSYHSINRGTLVTGEDGQCSFSMDCVPSRHAFSPNELRILASYSGVAHWFGKVLYQQILPERPDILALRINPYSHHLIGDPDFITACQSAKLPSVFDLPLIVSKQDVVSMFNKVFMDQSGNPFFQTITDNAYLDTLKEQHTKDFHRIPAIWRFLAQQMWSFQREIKRLERLSIQ